MGVWPHRPSWERMPSCFDVGSRSFYWMIALFLIARKLECYYCWENLLRDNSCLLCGLRGHGACVWDSRNWNVTFSDEGGVLQWLPAWADHIWQMGMVALCQWLGFPVGIKPAGSNGPRNHMGMTREGEKPGALGATLQAERRTCG